MRQCDNPDCDILSPRASATTQIAVPRGRNGGQYRQNSQPSQTLGAVFGASGVTITYRKPALISRANNYSPEFSISLKKSDKLSPK